jgi:hypothetical protein
MLASRQHIKLLFRDGQKSLYFACNGDVIGAEAREPVSNGQICIWVRMYKWCIVLSLGGRHYLTQPYNLNSWSNLRTYISILSGIVQARGPQGLPEE